MRKFAPALLAAMTLGATIATPASASFGLNSFDVTFTDSHGSEVTQAGAHPSTMTTSFGLNATETGEGGELPDEAPRAIDVEQIPGLVGDPNAVPTCATADFLTAVTDAEGANIPNCPDSSAVGVVSVTLSSEIGASTVYGAVYNLEPPPGVAAKLGFWVSGVPVPIELGVSESPPYEIVGGPNEISQVLGVLKSQFTLWGIPASPSHDSVRGRCIRPADGGSFDNCPAGIAEKPFLTLPRACNGPLTTSYEAFSWQGGFDAGSVQTHDNLGNPEGFGSCDRLAFEPSISTQPTSHSAESPSGLDVSVNVSDEGLRNATGTAGSDIEKAEVTLPEGMTINPSQAEGLGVCTEAQVKAETAHSEPGDGCPEASKIGVVEVETPLLEGEVLRGALFVAKPYANPFDSLIALYMTVKDPARGIGLSLAGKVSPDPTTGQLVGTFGEAGHELPQLPFSHFHLHFREGGRSPLVTPPHCGDFTAKAVFTPWAYPNHPIIRTSSFKVTSGVGGGPCPSGNTPPFSPGFEAGTLDNDAGSFSPSLLRLTRRDGDQDLTRFSATLPPGLVAKLAGTSECPDTAIAVAKAKTGDQELASPSCPASSLIGSVIAGAGVGPELTYVPGKIYLAGPFNGAPLSVVAVVPAVAGPFDVGDVVTRVALRIDPRTARVEADGAASDPIPHILAGIPLKVREIQVKVDKPKFTLNPTSCNPFAFGATLWGGGSNVFSTSDDMPISRSSRFQAASCASLGFRPQLALKLSGGTRRGAHPKLKGIFHPRSGDANLETLVLRLPHSAFLDQAHIRTICTRVQFTAKNCPPGAVYGKAKAFTPLLDTPLEGPVYLRSSDHNLPDFVAALHGLIDVETVARIDSVHGGIRATFTEVPDAPISKVVVEMQGAKKGLIVNSTNLCRGSHRARATLLAHNAKTETTRPIVRASCPTGRKRPPTRPPAAPHSKR